LKLDGKLPGAVVDNSTLTWDTKRERLLFVTKPYGKSPFDGEVWSLNWKTRTATALEGATAALKDMASKMGDSATAADKGAAATTETQASAAGLKEAMERSTKQMEELAALFTQLRDAQASSGEGSTKAVTTIANKIVDLQRQMDQQRKAMEDAVKLLNGLGG
jgi:hypothetical protein